MNPCQAGAAEKELLILYTIGALVLSEPVLDLIRRELRKIADGLRIDEEELESMLRGEVLKREVVEGDEPEAAQARVNKFYRKTQRKRAKDSGETQEASAKQEEEIAEPRVMPDKKECD